MRDDEESDFPEREALAALRRDVAPSDVLEERTVRALAARGLLQSSRGASHRVGRVAAIAACALFFIGGYVVGTRRAAPGTERTTIYSGEIQDEPVGSVVPADSQRAGTSTEFTLADPDSAAAAKTTVVWF